MSEAIAYLPDAELITHEERPYTGKDGQPRIYKAAVYRVGGKLMQLTVDKSFQIVDAMVGKKFELQIALTTFGESIVPTMRVVGVQK